MRWCLMDAGEENRPETSKSTEDGLTGMFHHLSIAEFSNAEATGGRRFFSMSVHTPNTLMSA